jgi:hypothetical protein
MKITVAVLVLLWSMSAGAYEFVTTQSSNPTNSDMSLSVQITPSVGAGLPGQFFVGAFLPNGGWVFLTTSGWKYWPGGAVGAIPSYASGSLNPVSITILNHADVSAFIGTRIFAGYGQSAGAMLAAQTYALVYTVDCQFPAVRNGSACVVPPPPPPPPPPTCLFPTVLNSGIGACVYPMGFWVVGANQLPPGCNTWKDQCWRDSVANGTVKFIATSAIMTGYSTRPIVFAYFRNTSTMFGVTGLWNYLPFYADDGSPFGPDIFGGSYSETDRVYGTAKNVANGTAGGIIIHDKSTGLCCELAWDTAQKSWDNNGTGSGTPITCPA